MLVEEHVSFVIGFIFGVTAFRAALAAVIRYLGEFSWRQAQLVLRVLSTLLGRLVTDRLGQSFAVVHGSYYY